MTARRLSQRISDYYSGPESLKRFLTLVGLALPVVGSIAATARYANSLETRPHAESTYVRQDSFAIYQARMAAKRERDSLIADAKMSRIDTSLNVLVRACRRRGDCP